MTRKIINCLYDHLKNSEKKLKIVCDWDEVIQPHEPYACYLEMTEKDKIYMSTFENYFTDRFWGDNKEHNYLGEQRTVIEYSVYGSKLKDGVDYYFGVYYDRNDKKTKQKRIESIERQQEIKNSSNFYREAPFLTIAEELLRLIKEDKVEEIIFLSAYNKRKFPNGDSRKGEIFKETFGKLSFNEGFEVYSIPVLELIGFDSENQGQTKADWIKENAIDFDIVIDDNPNICRSIANGFLKIHSNGCGTEHNPMVIAPHYSAIENQHHPEVLLIKTSVSDLKKEDF